MHTFNTKIGFEVLDSIQDMFGVDNLMPWSVSVEWKVEFEMRSWGIKSAIVTVPDQELVLMGEYYDEKDDLCCLEKVVKIKDVEVNTDNLSYNQLAPAVLSYYNGKWTLEF